MALDQKEAQVAQEKAQLGKIESKVKRLNAISVEAQQKKNEEKRGLLREASILIDELLEETSQFPKIRVQIEKIRDGLKASNQF